MKCAVAIVLALIGMVVANPVPPLSYGYGSPLLLPSAVSVSSSVINHGLSIPRVAVAPIISAPIIKTVAVPSIIKTPIITAPISLGWGGHGSYGLGGWGGHGSYGLGGWGGHGSYGLGGWGGYGVGGLGWGGLGLGGKGWH